jgi:hypothetical protein
MKWFIGFGLLSAILELWVIPIAKGACYTPHACASNTVGVTILHGISIFMPISKWAIKATISKNKTPI